MLGLFLAGEFHPSLNIALSAGSPVLFFASFANARVLFHQIHPRDFGVFAEQSLDLGGCHARGNAGDVDASALF